MSLINGQIPANTPCTYREQCPFAARGECFHKGIEHNTPFSCGAARAYEIDAKRAEKLKGKL